MSLDRVHVPAMELDQLEDGREAVRTDQQTTRATVATTRLAGVLAGQALLQLPVWGFAMSFGVFQEFFSAGPWASAATGVIGTTANGVLYLAMPLLFGLLARRWAHYRRAVALAGTVLAACSFAVAGSCTAVWQLIATLGVTAALGSSALYSPTTLSLGEWCSARQRAVAYGIVFSCKNVVGSTCPFLFRALLARLGLAGTLRVWAAVTGVTGVVAVLLVPTPGRGPAGDDDDDGDGRPAAEDRHRHRPRAIPWQFLRHRTFYVYAVATLLQSAGYGIPPTYLSTYAQDVLRLSDASATMLLTLFNVPGIVSSAFFGFLSADRPGRLALSTATATALSAVCSALAAWLLWGLAARGDLALLVVFSLVFGFFAGGYSATWAGVVRDLEREAAQRNEAVDGGIVYGLLNGARGLGYVSGGLAGVGLFAASSGSGEAGYGTRYGPLIVFTGLSTVFGGWGVLWGCWRG